MSALVNAPEFNEMANRGIYTPSKWGAEFHALPFREVLGAGSAGPGKSLVLLWDPFYQILEEHRRCTDPNHPHPIPMGTSSGRALHLRRKMPMLAETIGRSKRWFKMVDPGATFSASNNTPEWTFSSGFKYRFGHCNDRDDWQNYQGLELTYLAFDELCQFERKQYEEICARVRSVDPVLRHMLKIRSASNPVTRFEDGGASIMIDDPDWVRTMFVDPAPMGRVKLDTEVQLYDGTKEVTTKFYLPARLSDNPDPIFRRQYEVSLRGRPKHIREAYLNGNWYVTPGSYFGDDWNPDLHVCPVFRIPKEWPVWRSGDWGYKAWGCVHWWAMDPDGNIYCFREMSFRRKTATQVAEMIVDVEASLGLTSKKRKGSVLSGPMDNQLWEERGSSAKTKAAEMADVGVYWVKADKKSRARNAQLMMERILDHDEAQSTPGIVYFETCKEAIKTIPAVPRAKNIEAPADGGPDHWLDSGLYSCAFASRGREGIVDNGEDDDDWPEDRNPRQSSGRPGRANFGYGSTD